MQKAECPSPDPILMFNNPNSRAGGFAVLLFYDCIFESLSASNERNTSETASLNPSSNAY